MTASAAAAALCETTRPRIAQRSRIPELDGLRGIAVLAVLVSHFCAPLVPPSGLHRLLISGTYGVDLFFLLSGYLITGILLETCEGASYFRRFYSRRAFRIFPIYYAYLAIYFGVYGSASLHVSKAWYFLYLCNWRSVDLQPILLLHFWSLAVEEQYYLIWPAIVRFTSRSALAFISAAIVVASPIAVLIGHARHIGPSVLHHGTIFHLAPIALGSLLSALKIRIPRISWLRFRVLRDWGRYSYGAYVWHPFVLALVASRVLPGISTAWIRLLSSGVLGIGATYALARVSWALIEGPMARIKDRLTNRRDRLLKINADLVGSTALTRKAC